MKVSKIAYVVLQPNKGCNIQEFHDDMVEFSAANRVDVRGTFKDKETVVKYNDLRWQVKSSEGEYD